MRPKKASAQTVAKHSENGTLLPNVDSFSRSTQIRKTDVCDKERLHRDSTFIPQSVKHVTPHVRLKPSRRVPASPPTWKLIRTEAKGPTGPGERLDEVFCCLCLWPSSLGVCLNSFLLPSHLVYVQPDFPKALPDLFFFCSLRRHPSADSFFPSSCC